MRQEPKNILEDLIVFYKQLLIPFMKIRRDMPFPTEPERMETDGEHAFTLAMVALSLNERLNLKLDTGKISQYALVHDLVEVHAGDLSVKAPEADHALKDTKEREAYQKIKSDFSNIFPWVHRTIREYEKKKDKESKFVYVVDKYAGALGWLSGEGAGWKQYYPQENGALYHIVIDRLRSKVKTHGDDVMLEFFDYIHEELDKKRVEYYKNSK